MQMEINLLNSTSESPVTVNINNLKMVNERKRTRSIEINDADGMPAKNRANQSRICCECCKLMCSGRGLPVARRGRPFYSSKNDRSQSMCEKCNETLTQQQQHKFSSYSNRTKTLTVDNLALDSNDSPLFRNIFDEILGQDCSYSLSTNNPVVIADATALQQQHDVLELNDDNSASQKISTATTINGDLPTEIEFMLNETKSMDMNDYQSAQMLIWKLNVSGDVDLSYDTSSSPLTDDEKRVLVDEAVKKLNVALSSHKIPLDGVDVDAVNLTYAALNKTLQTLSANTL